MPHVALEWMVSLGMSKYIANDYLENIIDYYLGHSNGAEHYAYGVMRGELRIAPAADVVEVKHGCWVIEEYDHICNVTCSVCGKDYACHYGMLQLHNFSYCPNCGAYMRKTYERV